MINADPFQDRVAACQAALQKRDTDAIVCFPSEHDLSVGLCGGIDGTPPPAIHLD